MRNGRAARDNRKRVADENAAARANRSDSEQLKRLVKQGHTAARESARLVARIEAARVAKK